MVIDKSYKDRLLISGAGPIGLAMAIGLKDSPFDITLIDGNPAPNKTLLESDQRMMALSKKSHYLLNDLEVWDLIAPHATPIKHVHVSQEKYKTAVTMHAYEHKLDDFGSLVPMGQLVIALHKKIERQKNVRFIPHRHLKHYQVDQESNKAVCQFEGINGVYKEVYDWIISAEGVNSQLRQMAGIETYHYDYEQIAVIAVGKFNKPHNNVAYERFTAEGPLALLPIDTHHMAMVLVVPSQKKPKWQLGTDIEYINEVVGRIGHSKLGTLVHVTPRQLWDLTLMIPKRLTAPKLVLSGNSAHALHPIAGQGLNLGFRDCEMLISCFKQGIPTDFELKQYERIRRKDICQIVGATDFLVRSFDIALPPIPLLRDFVLRSVQRISPLKKKIAQFGMGL